MNAMNAINAINDQKNNATTCNQQPNGGGKVTPAHYEELEELQLESVAGGWEKKTAAEKEKEKLNSWREAYNFLNAIQRKYSGK